jgi:hypothetical protein
MEMRLKQCRAAIERLGRLKGGEGLADAIAEQQVIIDKALANIKLLESEAADAEGHIKQWRKKANSLVRAIEAAEDHPELIPFMTVQRQLKQGGLSPEECQTAFE